MLTREQIEEIKAESCEKVISIKKLLDEKGIPHHPEVLLLMVLQFLQALDLTPPPFAFIHFQTKASVAAAYLR